MENSNAAQVRRRFGATPEAVFAAFADPGLVARWLKPAPEIGLAVLAFDFRVGGAYRFAYHLPDGAVMTVRGTFQSIRPPSALAFSWIIEPPDEHAGIVSEVAVSITPQRGGAELHIRHEKLDRSGAPERHAQGWQGALDRLAALLSPEETAA
jgi:uncharacterized protein YndB with AHSA1/START domain